MNGTPIPHRAAPRQSGIPAPGRLSSIPTPGRPRSSVSTSHPDSPDTQDTDAMHRALSDAIKANDPARFRPTSSIVNNASLSPESADTSRRKSAGPGARNLRPPSSASAVSASSSTGLRISVPHSDSPSPNNFTTAPSTPIGPPGGNLRTKTPLTTSTRGTGMFTPHRRPDSRQSNVGQPSGPPPARSASRLGNVIERSSSRMGKAFEVGDKVKIESLGMEGSLRFLGEVSFKPGIWAGVELSGGFAGRGKNDGTVNGIRYFNCPPQCGVFVASNKLSNPAPSHTRPPSSASVQSARSGRATPSFPFPKPLDFETPVAQRRPSADAAAIAAGRITAGSRASRYLNMTAKELAEQPAPPPRQPSPTRSPTRPTTTPKNLTFSGRQSMGPGIPTPAAYKSRLSMGGPTPKPGRGLARGGTSPLPPSPSLPALSVTSTSADNSLHEDADDPSMLQSTTRAFQDRIQKLMSDDSVLSASARSSPMASPSGQSDKVFPGARPASRNGGRPSSRNSVGRPASRNDNQLYERLESLERENLRLAAAAESAASSARQDASGSGAMIGELQNRLRETERLLQQQRERIESLEQEVQSQLAAREDEKEQAAAVLRAADERVEEVEQRERDAAEEAARERARVSGLEGEIRGRTEEVLELQRKVEAIGREKDEDREDLQAQVDELRRAGQETIALYEERLANSETVRYELEDQIAALEDRVQAASAAHRAPSPMELTRVADTAALIDNETLREQAAHFQARIGALEEQLEEARVERRRLEEVERGRVGKAREVEGAMRKELEGVRKELEVVRKEGEVARGRVTELEGALRESDEALENARAEIEGLRSELANRHELGDITNHPGAVKAQAQLSDEVAHLKQLLDEARAARQETLGHSESLRQQVDVANNTIADLRARLDALEKDRSEGERPSLDLQFKVSDRNLSPHDPRRDSYSSISSKLSRKSSSEKDKDKESRDQIAGLKHIVQDLQKENAALVSQIKMLEADKKALNAEAEELKEAMKTLEDTVEENLLREEQALDTDLAGEASGAPNNDVAQLQKVMADLKAKHAAELEAQKKLATKNERTINDLNKEVAELESLVESKIYREDDLERELERYKEKLARAQRTPKSSLEPRPSSRSRTPSFPNIAKEEQPSSEDICEICGGRGHDLSTCPIFGDDSTSSKLSNGQDVEQLADTTLRPSTSSHVWCDECESPGHTASECPHSQDVF